MHDDATATIHQSLRALAIGGFLFQSRVAASHGLHPTDLQAVHVLGSRGPSTAGDLASALGVTSGGLTAVVDRLIALDLAIRERDPADRRRVRIALRPGPALDALRGEYSAVDARVAALLADRDPAQRAVIAAFLQALVAAP
ncbi:MAG: winged helix-turn-helix transcriptional regulator [Alphaproteobacteria bacterium]|nr:winged helix-turn-helix transcriptional regulator [Alphaproteobacteria bacterium]